MLEGRRRTSLSVYGNHPLDRRSFSYHQSLNLVSVSEPIRERSGAVPPALRVPSYLKVEVLHQEMAYELVTLYSIPQTMFRD